ncbi:MAG TPA: gamma-glutamyltransferase [Pirellulaceae bacterium]|jgi:gamma-glutamyltranspeptidase/glutathione hydrolase
MLAALTMLTSVALAADLPPNAAVSTKGMVASVHPLATEAGVAALRKGGNAIDAAVAVGLTLSVVDARNSGIGGGCFILIRRADGEFFAIDARETAPAKATRDMYLQDGKPQPVWSQSGPLAAATPGALAGYALAVKEHGRLKLADLAGPAGELAERGFAIDKPNAAALASAAKTLIKNCGPNVSLLKADGSAYREGELLKQPDLAKVFRGIAEQGTDYFYRGPFAAAVGKWMAEHGGRMTVDDFAKYQPVLREPLVTTYRERTIVGFPPPSSGGVHVAQMLNILENFDVAAIYQRDPGEYQHLLAEAMKLAFADRAYWLGDPDFARVPRGLIDKGYAKSLAARIDLAKAMPVTNHGTPPDSDENVFLKHTTHVAAADSEGNWVAMTQTVNTSYGCKVIVPGTGVVLNNEMDDFSIAPGQPNAFKLIGAEANAVEPLKRPLSSMSPTIVLENGQPVLTVGAAGGPTIITQVLQALVRRIDLGLPLDQSLAQPRIHHQWSPDAVRIETKLDESLQKALTSRGHELTPVASMGVTQAIELDRATGKFLGVHDPRVPGKVAGP